MGLVLFDNGRVVHAAYGNLVGPPAFYQLMAEVDGQFEFSPGPCDLPESERTLTDSLTMLIMEGARIQDTVAAQRGDESGQRVARRSDAQRPRLGSTFPGELRPPLVPESILAAQYEVAMRDGFALGELQVWTREELEKWCSKDVGRDRFHVHLIADMAAGVSSILSLGGAPTERWVLGSLMAVPKALGLSFFFRHDRLLDLILLDARDPAAFQASLRRTPSVVIVAPPMGDMMALGTRGRVALEGMLRELAPPAIVGVGNGALPGALAALGVPATESSTLRCTTGILGEGASDLRSLLIKGIRLWSATPKDRRVRGGGAE